MSQVKNKFLAQIPAHSYKGNNTASLANAIDVTNTQLTADLNLFTNALQGLVPLSGGGTVNFLRADGTWAAPAYPTLTSLGIFSGNATLASGLTTKAVTFSTAFGSTNYSVTANLLNTTDTNPQFQPITITAQSTTGFTATWNEPTATANYVLSWHAIANN